MGPNSTALRDAFDEWVRLEIIRMEDDPERAAEIGRAIRRVIAHETVQAWAWDVWSRLRVTLEADSARPNGRTIALLEKRHSQFGRIGWPTTKPRAGGCRIPPEKLVAGLLPGGANPNRGFHRRRGGELGYSHDHGAAGTAGGAGSAICADEWYVGGRFGRGGVVCYFACGFWAGGFLRRRQAVLFLKKRTKKTLVHLGGVWGLAPAPARKDSFC